MSEWIWAVAALIAAVIVVVIVLVAVRSRRSAQSAQTPAHQDTFVQSRSGAEVSSDAANLPDLGQQPVADPDHAQGYGWLRASDLVNGKK